MRVRDLWYQTGSRCDHSSVGQTAKCLPGIWEAWSESKTLLLQALCWFVQTFTHVSWLHCATTWAQQREHPPLWSCKVASHESSVICTLCTASPHLPPFYRKFFYVWRHLYWVRNLNMRHIRPLQDFLIHIIWPVQHVLLCHLMFPHGYYIRHRHKHR